MSSIISFFRKIEKIEDAVKIIKKCSILFAVAGALESILGLLFLPHIFYTGVINLLLGGLLFFVNTRSVGMVVFLWSLVPFISEFTVKISLGEFCYVIFTAALSVIGLRAFLATLKLHKLLFPEEEKV